MLKDTETLSCRSDSTNHFGAFKSHFLTELILWILDSTSNEQKKCCYVGTKVKKEFSNPKRLSFLLGKNQKIHTANSQLVKLGKVKSLDDLHSRFQIEIVNKEFFDNYKNLFENLSKNLQTDKVFIKFLKIGTATEEPVCLYPRLFGLSKPM